VIDLNTMSDTAVWELVKDRLGMEHDWSNLYTGDNVTVLRAVLQSQIIDLQLQLAEQNSHLDVLHQECMDSGAGGKARYFKERADYQAWKASALHFKRLAERRMAEVKRLDDIRRRTAHAEAEQQRAQALRDLVRRLAVAIADHQDETTEQSTPSSADVALWAILDRETVPVGGGVATLAEMLDGVWTGQP
jgi:alpha-D-ribose 1-methylphosphonate 5-triphosphate diphosphatase PhnM